MENMIKIKLGGKQNVQTQQQLPQLSELSEKE